MEKGQQTKDGQWEFYDAECLVEGGGLRYLIGHGSSFIIYL